MDSTDKKIVGVGVFGVACLVAASIMSGCDVATENHPTSITKVAERDGCSVYRFWDAEKYHYFVKYDNGERPVMIPDKKKRHVHVEKDE